MAYNLNKPATIKEMQLIDNVPTEVTLTHIYDFTMAEWLAGELEARLNSENPELEYSIAVQLRTNGEFSCSDEDLEVIRKIVLAYSKDNPDSRGTKIDNRFKSQVLACFTAA